MNLLILTQKLDKEDKGVLGFMHGWVFEFSKHCPKLTVAALSVGEFDLPANVKVISLGKEKLPQRIPATVRKLIYSVNFYKYIWRERKNYDAVFVHMNQIYVILGGLLWKILGKKIGFWYAHGATSFSLRLAEKFSDIIFTSTESGFRLESPKKKVVGQGIDIEIFKADGSKESGPAFRIITVGRISPVKDYETLIWACESLSGEGVGFEALIIGEAALESDKIYLQKLKKSAAKPGLRNRIKFLGGISNRQIAGYLQSSDLFVNMSRTGSLDKTLAEAMACELPIITCNEALLEILGSYKDSLMYPAQDREAFLKKIEMIFGMPPDQRNEIGRALRRIIVQNHSRENLIKKILNHYEKDDIASARA